MLHILMNFAYHNPLTFAVIVYMLVTAVLIVKFYMNENKLHPKK